MNPLKSRNPAILRARRYARIIKIAPHRYNVYLECEAHSFFIEQTSYRCRAEIVKEQLAVAIARIIEKEQSNKREEK